MLLRKKTQFIVSITLVCLILILYVVLRATLLDSFFQLEERDTQRQVEWVKSALANDISMLDTLTSDWAAWDDTFAFIQDGNQDYIQSNLVDETFIGSRLNLMLFVNNSGKTVFGKAFDLQTAQETSLPNGIQAHLVPDAPLLDHPDPESHATGIILLPQGPLLVASRSIVTSEEQGPVRGALIVGRFLDKAVVDRLAQNTRLTLTFEPVDGSPLPNDLATAQSKITAKNPIFVRALDRREIAGYALLKDIYGEPVLLMRVSLAREIYQQGQFSLIYFLAISVTGLLAGGLILLLLERTVLSRLAQLNKNVSQIGVQGDLTARVALSGEDELGKLAYDINQMLDALEQSQHDLRKSEAKFRGVIEQSADGIILVDEQGIIVEWNRGQEKISQTQRENVLGQPFADVYFQMFPQRHTAPEARESFAQSWKTFQREGCLPWMNKLQEQTIHNPNDTSHIVQSLIFPIKTTKGWMACSISRDITKQKHTQIELNQRLAEQETIFAIGQLISSSLNIDEAMQLVAEYMARLVNAAGCVIFDWHLASGMLVIKTKYITPNSRSSTIPQLEQSPGLLDRHTASTGLPNTEPISLYADDPQTAAQERQHLKDHRLSGVAEIPIVSQDKLIGLAKVYLAENTPPFSGHDLRVLQALSNQVAIAINNARLFAAVQTNEAALRNLSLRLLNVQEQERRQIAQGLHDELGQLLTALTINIDLARRKLPADATALHQRLDEANALANKVLTNVRNLTVELRPLLLDDLGLVPTLRWYLGRFAQRSNVQVELHAQELPERLLPESETAIYRGVQEALTNVSRHAQASQVRVQLELSGDMVIATIEDDGRGFDVKDWSNNRNQRQTLGLTGMEERAMLLDGWVLIKSRPGEGTRIEIALPAQFVSLKED